MFMPVYNANLKVQNMKLIYNENMFWYYEYTLLRSGRRLVCESGTSCWTRLSNETWKLPPEDITPHTTFRFSSDLSRITSKTTSQSNRMYITQMLEQFVTLYPQTDN